MLLSQVIAKERPDALLPTMGGQTALNLAKALAEGGVLEKYSVELIGAKLDAINKAEDRELFKAAMDKIGIKSPPSGVGNTLQVRREKTRGARRGTRQSMDRRDKGTGGQHAAGGKRRR